MLGIARPALAVTVDKVKPDGVRSASEEMRTGKAIPSTTSYAIGMPEPDDLRHE